MTNEEAKIIHQRYAKLKFTHDEKNAISDCYMQGINRDGHVWVTWTDVERILCDMADADKYAWHDLRKNPDDLPPCEQRVEIIAEWTHIMNPSTKKKGYVKTFAMHEDGKMKEDESAWSWCDAEGCTEYNEKEDTYYLLEGWYEDRICGEYPCNAVDDVVIKWRYIEPCEEEAE